MAQNQYSLKEIHAGMLDVQKFIHSFCEKHSITYSLTGGSLLGAIRHNGFIPWDDDFDIMFDRKNFTLFVDAMRSYEGSDYILELDQWVYRVRKNNCEAAVVPSVDLFVLDETPENRVTRKWQIICLRILQGLLRDNHNISKHSLFFRVCIRIAEFIGNLFNKERLFEKYDKISRLGEKKPSGNLSILDDKFRYLSYTYSGNLIDRTELHKFEDTEFSIISNYEEYLTTQYGDYMQLPPEASRVPEHTV